MDSPTAHITEDIKYTSPLYPLSHLLAIGALVEEPTSLLAVHKGRFKPSTIFFELDDIRHFSHRDTHEGGQPLKCSNATVIAPQDSGRVKDSLEGLKNVLIPCLHTSCIELNHQHIVEPIDDETRQAITLPKDQTIVWLVVEHLAQFEGTSVPREGWLIAAKAHDTHKSSLATPGQLEVRCKAATTWEQSVVARAEFEFGANWASARVDAYVRLERDEAELRAAESRWREEAGLAQRREAQAAQARAEKRGEAFEEAEPFTAKQIKEVEDEEPEADPSPKKPWGNGEGGATAGGASPQHQFRAPRPRGGARRELPGARRTFGLRIGAVDAQERLRLRRSQHQPRVVCPR